jgi:hypothetical protein
MPAEWEKHEGTWLQWPQDKVYRSYELKLKGMWLAMVDALHQHENVHAIVADGRQLDHVVHQLEYFAIGLENVQFYSIPTNDVWARDNGPTFVVNSDGDVAITDWKFNGWGERFPHDLDNQVPAAIGEHLSMPVFKPAMVLKGGAVEVNGSGTFMATRTSIIDPHRNPGMSQEEIEAILSEYQVDTGTHISAHEYHDVLKTDEDLAKLQIPQITYEREGTEQAVAVAEDVFSGLMPVRAVGVQLKYSIWDQIARYRGVESLLLDLVMRPDFMHRTARRFTDIAAATFRQYRDLDLLHPSPFLLHCTVACSRDLPASDFTGKVRYQDVWGRCAAQIFGSVSPDMHDEFDLAYNQELFSECGLLYYGCCEPLDRKIDILRKRFRNLRKISVTPWADPERAACGIGKDYVLAAKPNPCPGRILSSVQEK